MSLPTEGKHRREEMESQGGSGARTRTSGASLRFGGTCAGPSRTVVEAVALAKTLPSSISRARPVWAHFPLTSRTRRVYPSIGRPQRVVRSPSRFQRSPLPRVGVTRFLKPRSQESTRLSLAQLAGGASADCGPMALRGLRRSLRARTLKRAVARCPSEAIDAPACGCFASFSTIPAGRRRSRGRRWRRRIR